jgi:hypothetical protein
MHKILVRKPEALHREDNIKMLVETRWESLVWVHLVLDRDQWQILVNMVMNLQVPSR